MTKAEWMDGVVARIPEDGRVRCWSILTESEESYHIAVGEKSSGAEMLELVYHTLLHVAETMNKTPAKIAKVAIALGEAKKAFDEGPEEDDDDR